MELEKFIYELAAEENILISKEDIPEILEKAKNSLELPISVKEEIDTYLNTRDESFISDESIKFLKACRGGMHLFLPRE